MNQPNPMPRLGKTGQKKSSSPDPALVAAQIPVVSAVTPIQPLRESRDSRRTFSSASVRAQHAEHDVAVGVARAQGRSRLRARVGAQPIPLPCHGPSVPRPRSWAPDAVDLLSDRA